MVTKFGGSSVAGTDRIKNVAARLAQLKQNNRLIVVVSAMGDTTDMLHNLAYEVSAQPPLRELDMLLTAGERISMSLLSIALQEHGIEAISFTGSQSGIITDNHHGNARITDVTAFRIRQELDKGKVVIVAGFQGVSPQKEVTTLGRGGSDTTAIALAAYLNASQCLIFSDVDGVYTADPRLTRAAHKLDKIEHRQMLALAYGGARVMHSRSVEFAMKYHVDFEVRSSLTNQQGTLVTAQNISEERLVTAIAHKNDMHLVTANLDTESTALAYQYVEDQNIYLFDTYILAPGKVVFVTNAPGKQLLSANLNRLVAKFKVQDDLCCLSLVGTRLGKDFAFCGRLLSLLQDNKFKLVAFIPRELSLNLVLKTPSASEAVKLLHQTYLEGNDV